MKTLSMLSRLVVSLTLALSLCPQANAQVVIIFPPVTLVDGSTPGYYNASLGTILDGTAPQFPLPLGAGGGDPLIYPSAEPNLSAASNVLGNWLTPNAVLNPTNWLNAPTIPATWSGNTETAIIYEINGGNYGITNLIGDFDADNGLFVWVNGQFKFGARGPGLPSPTGQFEYTNILLGNLLPGTNRIQIIREDNFDATGYQVRIMGSPLGGPLVPPPCVPTPAGLVSWWRAEGTGADSADGNNGVLLNGASFAEGRVNQAFSFDGVNDHVRVADHPSLRMTNGLTVEAWIYPTLISGDRELVSKWDAVIGPNQRSFTVALQPDGRAYLGLSGDGVNVGAVVYSANPIPANQWSYLSATYDGAALRIYVNGVLENQTAYSGGIFPGTSDIGIGQNVGGSIVASTPPFAAPYAGRIDELGIYNRALTAGEIQSIYAAASTGKCTTNPPVVNCTSAPSGLVSWWSGESSAIDRADGNTGTLVGDIFFAPGQVGNAFNLDGNGDAVFIGNPANLRLQNLTIECWMKRASTTQVSGHPLYGQMVGYGPGGYVLGFRADGSLFLSKNTVSDVPSVATITDTNWHHVAVTKGGNTVVFYVDGVAGVPITYDTAFEFFTDLRIGAVNDGVEQSFLGAIDEVSIYNRALTATEIQSIYNSSTAGKCQTNPPVVNCTSAPSGLVSWWSGEANTLDRTGANVGTIVGNTSYGMGWIGQGFVFDGSGDGVSVGNPASLQLQDFTIETWIRRANTSVVSMVANDAGIFTYGQGGYSLGIFNNGNLFLSKVGIDAVILNTGITDTNFHHVAVSKSGTVVVFYIDGVQYPVPAFNSAFVFATPAAIGARGDNLDESFWGEIDELSIYNRALTAGEIQSIYNASTAGKCPLPPPPVITQHPTNRTVNATATAQFAVAATGAPTLRYQWFFGENPLANQTNASLSIANALPINQGLYRVTVSNDFGFAISSNATLTVLTFPPVITRQPTNLTVIVGSTTNLFVQATGSPTLAYQWLSNGIPMPGRTSPSLAFQNVQFSNAGNYSVIVTNPYGAVTSAVAVLTVNPTPTCVAVHDGLVSWWKGENNALDNWDFNNGNNQFVNTTTIGKVGRAFINPFITVNDSSSLRVTNGLTLEAWINPSSLTSTRVILSKFEYPLFQPFGTQSAYLLGTTNNGALFFTLTPNGSVRTNTTLVTTNLIPLNQWTHVAATYDGSVMRLYINGSQIREINHVGNIFPGSTPLGIGGFAGPSFQTSSPWQYSGLMDEVSLYNRALSASEIQSIVAADFAGKCLAPPVVTLQPQDQIVPLGEDVKFTVGVSGSRPLAYQWYFSNPARQFVNERIFGATNSSLIIERVRANNVGFYFVTVTNSVGSNFTARAELSTLPAPSCVDVLPGIISWWPADGNALDAMGLNNAFTTLTSGAYVTGKVASAFTFNGVNTRALVESSSQNSSLNFTNNQNFSIEMWIKAANTNAVNANVPLLEKREQVTTGWLGYSLSLNNGRLAFALGAPLSPAGGRTNRMFVSSGPDLRDSFFHHVAVTVDRTNANGGVLYVDGAPALVFDPRPFTNSLAHFNALLMAGPVSTSSNSYFNGLIDEPAIYGRALTAAEILSIRTAGAAGRCKSRPTIVVQPVGGTVDVGSNFTMNVTASGTPLLRYQWRRNTALLSGATNSTLTLSNASLALAGTYSVIVSNAFGSVISANAILVISNRPPTAVSSSFSVLEDRPIDVLLTGTDPENNPLTYSIVTQPTNGTLAGSPIGRFRVYTPFQNYHGPDFFTYKVNDGFSDSPIATMAINVLPVNDAPVSFSEQFAMDEDTTLPIQLRADDVDDTELTFEIIQQPVHGTLTGSGAKRFYTPGTNYFGDDYFTFIARDGSNAVSQVAAVTIAIRPVNDAPVARIVITPLDQLPGETNTVLISPACCDTTLILDGSQSSDVENTPLTYIWLDGTNVIATTATFTNRFAPGVHELALIVSDGELSGTELLTVEILKTEEAVLHLQALVQTSALARNEKAALINWLKVTINALEDCKVDKAIMFLERFEARVAERIAVINAKDAERWIATSQAIREVAGLCDTTTRPCKEKDDDDDDRDDDNDKSKNEKSDERKSNRDSSGRGNSKTGNAAVKSEQENRGDRGNSDEVRAGKSSPR